MLLLDEILKELKKAIRISEHDFIAYKVFRETGSSFKTLIATILSQNTRENNAFKAYEQLEKSIGLDPPKIIEAPLDKIAETIKPAGLYKLKAKAIKEVAKKFPREEDLTQLLESKDPGRIREALMNIPGVGLKTVDVLLVNYGYPVIPLDTHIQRVARRLGIADKGDNYLDIQQKLMTKASPENFLELHLYLIKLGRLYCHANKPACSKCPVNTYCKYFKKTSNF